MASRAKKLPLATILIALLSLFSTILLSQASAKKDPELQQCLQQCRQQRHFDKSQQERCERACRESYEEGGRDGSWGEEEEAGRGGHDNPYVFDQEEHFSTSIETQEGKVRVLQRFDERSEFLEGIRRYRLSILEADPHTFALPSHGDADVVLYVSQGKKFISSCRHKKNSRMERNPYFQCLFFVNFLEEVFMVLWHMVLIVSIPFLWC